MDLPQIAFWDMDHTLAANDADVSWKQYLVHKGLAPADALAQADAYYAQYAAGDLRFEEFIAWQLQEFRGLTPGQLGELCAEHYREWVRPRVYPEGRALVAAQGMAGVHLVLLTATNRMVAAPCAADLGFAELIATEPELADGRFTGRIHGRYCGGEGKRDTLLERCAAAAVAPAAVAYYGDSIADIPVLAAVGHPVCVNPMPRLRAEAAARGWPILTFRLP